MLLSTRISTPTFSPSTTTALNLKPTSTLRISPVSKSEAWKKMAVVLRLEEDDSSILNPRMTIMDGAEARNDDHGQSYLVELRIGIGYSKQKTRDRGESRESRATQHLIAGESKRKVQGRIVDGRIQKKFIKYRAKLVFR